MKDVRCSLKRPVCVRVGLLAAAPLLADLERAFEEVSWGASFPRDDVTFERPLIWDLEGDRATLDLVVRRSPSRSFDRGRALCVGGAPHLDTARRCVMAALTSAIAPATAPWLRDGHAAKWAEALGSSPEASAARVNSWLHPEVGVLTNTKRVDDLQGRPSVFVSELRSVRFFDYLESRARAGLGEAGFLALTLATTRTPSGQSRWEAEPDLFDVLSVTLEGDRVAVARLLDDFAQYSHRVGNEQGPRLEPDWVIEGTSLPRTVAFPRSVEPTGSLYLRVDLAEDQLNEVLGFRIGCEAPVSYVWSVARLSVAGDEISRMPLTYRQRGGEASGRVLPVAGQKSLLLAGTNVGGVDLAHPFDPDHGPHEAHGCHVAINVVPADVAAREPE